MIVKLFVMLVRKQKVINYLTLFPLVCQQNPCNLFFSDVWGPAPSSVGRHTYYVSFIDDYSKFDWIYLLKRRSNVFQVFQNFQALVEHKFDSKIIAVQSD